MRRKYRIIVILCVIVLVLTGISWVMKNSIGFSTGTCIAADNGRFLVVIDNSPIAMYQRSGRGSLFSDLDTGDKIFLIHDGIAESYPGKTGVYGIIKLSEGEEKDVPVEVIEALKELGWITK